MIMLEYKKVKSKLVIGHLFLKPFSERKIYTSENFLDSS